MANEVRTGLEGVEVALPTLSVVAKVHPLDADWMGKSVRQHVKEFAAIFGTIFFAVSAYRIYHQGLGVVPLSWAAAGLVTAFLGYFAPSVLHPLWRAWMKLAHYLSIVVTSVLLLVMWCIGFVPMAYLLRVLGIKRIDLSYRAEVASYWEHRDPKYDDFKRLEQQF